jgi:hypothetical protein
MSVGHIARAFESSGIATVVIAVKSFETRMRMMALPRVLLTRELVGRPLGNPFNRNKQKLIVKQALALLETAEKNGTVQELTNGI